MVFSAAAAAVTGGLIRAAADGWGGGLAGTAPLSLAAFVLSALIGRWLHAANPRWLVGAGMLLIGTGALLQSNLYAQSGGLALLPGLIVAARAWGWPPRRSSRTPWPRCRGGPAGWRPAP